MTYDIDKDVEKGVYTLKQSSMTQSAIESFYDFLQLTKHGAKFIDIHVRKDAKEYTFQADFLKYITLTNSNAVKELKEAQEENKRLKMALEYCKDTFVKIASQLKEKP